MVALRQHAPARMTVTEFLAWDAGDLSDVPYQLIDGEPVAMAPGSETHAALQGEIGRLIGQSPDRTRQPLSCAHGAGDRSPHPRQPELSDPRSWGDLCAALTQPDGIRADPA